VIECTVGPGEHVETVAGRSGRHSLQCDVLQYLVAASLAVVGKLFRGVFQCLEDRRSEPWVERKDPDEVRGVAGGASPVSAADRSWPGLWPNSRLKARLKLEPAAKHKFSAIADIDFVVVGSLTTA
jgi:hypothetical protein